MNSSFVVDIGRENNLIKGFAFILLDVIATGVPKVVSCGSGHM